jgi:hypothetical protein
MTEPADDLALVLLCYTADHDVVTIGDSLLGSRYSIMILGPSSGLSVALQMRGLLGRCPFRLPPGPAG